MDSGPNGDSFLAPRMLPDPDEGGDYRWPTSCTYLNSKPVLSVIAPQRSSLLTSDLLRHSLPSNPSPHIIIPMVFVRLSNRRDAAFRRRNLRRPIHTRRIRQLLGIIEEVLPERHTNRKADLTTPSGLFPCHRHECRMALIRCNSRWSQRLGYIPPRPAQRRQRNPTPTPSRSHQDAKSRSLPDCRGGYKLGTCYALFTDGPAYTSISIASDKDSNYNSSKCTISDTRLTASNAIHNPTRNTTHRLSLILHLRTIRLKEYRISTSAWNLGSSLVVCNPFTSTPPPLSPAILPIPGGQ